MTCNTADLKLRLLIFESHPNSLRDSRGNTKLHTAIIAGTEKEVNALLQAGADVHAKNNAGKSPLDLAQNTFMQAYKPFLVLFVQRYS